MATKMNIFAGALYLLSTCVANPVDKTVAERATPTFKACPKASTFRMYISNNGSLTGGTFGKAFEGDVNDSFYIVDATSQKTLPGSMVFTLNSTNGHLTSVLSDQGKDKVYIAYTVIDQDFSAVSPLYFGPKGQVNGNTTESETPIPTCNTTNGTLQCNSLGANTFAICNDQALRLAYNPNYPGCHPVVVTPVCKT